jgi:hypothetical protein
MPPTAYGLGVVAGMARSHGGSEAIGAVGLQGEG